MTFTAKFDEDTVAEWVRLRAEGQTLAEVAALYDTSEATVSRRTRDHARRRTEQAAVSLQQGERRGYRPENDDPRPAPPAAVTDEQARARLAERTSRDAGRPHTVLWKDAGRFAPWGTTFALAFELDDAGPVLTHPSPEFAGSTRRFSQPRAEDALWAMKKRGLLFSPEPDRLGARLPKEIHWSGRDRKIVVPGCRNTIEAGHLAFREWCRVYKPGRGGELGEWLDRRDAEREARAAAPPDPRVKILDAAGNFRAACKQSNADRVAAALNLEGAWTIHPEPIAPAAAPSPS